MRKRGMGTDMWGKGESSNAEAHIERIANLVTFSSNKARELYYI